MGSRPRRTSRVGATLVLVAAGVLAFAVIPPVRNDTFSLARRDEAATAFWITAIASLIAGAIALFASRVDGRPRRWLLGVAGSVAAVVGLLLIDAAAAFSGHGPDMRYTVLALWACVGLELAGGLTMGFAAFKWGRVVG